jgi:hypothetical protein
MIARREPPFWPFSHWAILASLGVRYPGGMSPNRTIPKIKFWKNLDPLLGKAFRRTHPHDQLSNFPHSPKNSAYCTRDNRFTLRARRELPFLEAFRMYKIIKKKSRNKPLWGSTKRSQWQSV